MIVKKYPYVVGLMAAMTVYHLFLMIRTSLSETENATVKLKTCFSSSAVSEQLKNDYCTMKGTLSVNSFTSKYNLVFEDGKSISFGQNDFYSITFPSPAPIPTMEK